MTPRKNKTTLRLLGENLMIAVIVAALLLGTWWYVEEKTVRLSPELKRELREYIVGIDGLPSRVGFGDREYVVRTATDYNAKWKAIELALPEGASNDFKWKEAKAELALAAIQLQVARDAAGDFWTNETATSIAKAFAEAKSQTQAAKTALSDTLKD
jgi:hypothetical protein